MLLDPVHQSDCRSTRLPLQLHKECTQILLCLTSFFSSSPFAHASVSHGLPREYFRHRREPFPADVPIFGINSSNLYGSISITRALINGWKRIAEILKVASHEAPHDTLPRSSIASRTRAFTVTGDEISPLILKLQRNSSTGIET